MSDKKDNSFQAFDTTKVTTLGDDLFKISSKIPFFLFSILMEGLSVVFFTAVFILWAIDPDTWILDELCIFGAFSVFFFGLILLTSVLKFFKPFMKITDKIKPIRFKVKMEMFPVNKDKILEDLINRLDDVFYLGINDFKGFLKKTVKRNGKSHTFDIYYKNNQNSLIYIVTIALILFLLATIFVEAIIYSQFDSIINFILLGVLEFIVLTIFVLMILRFFFRTEVILMKYYKKEVTVKDIGEFKADCEEVLNWSKYPLEIGILSSKGFTKDAIEFAKHSRAKVRGEYTISLIQLEGNMFKVIWTG